jgi:ribose transport system permease protein
VSEQVEEKPSDIELVQTSLVVTKRKLSARDYGIIVFLILIIVALAVSSGPFRSEANLSNIVNQMSMGGVAACGATLTIVAGGFDLSQGSVYAICAIVAVMTTSTLGPFGAFALALIVGLGLGAVNGTVIAFGRVNSFIATLASSYAFIGLATIMTAGNVEESMAPHFMVMNNDVLGLTVASWVFIGVAVLTGILLAYTRFGRGLYAIGGNPEAARLSGISISFYRVVAFALSGGCAAIAGIINASQTGSADASIGSTVALMAIAATVIGGTSIMGGEGAIWRAVVGALIIELIGNGFILLNINSNYESVVFGVLILIAVALDQLLRRRAT